MKTKNLIFVMAWALLAGIVSCKQDHEIPTDIVFNPNDGEHNGHSYVDLGLPSGTLWATCNVGASAVEDYGYYFAWGETQPKDFYNWSTYRHCKGDESTFTKYCSNSDYGNNGFTDNLTTLQPADDAATANWGGSWHIPTKEEWQELYDNTTKSWVSKNGVNGCQFSATNGNSIFLPAAGDSMEDSFYHLTTDGYYWSSTLYLENNNGAWSYHSQSGTYKSAADYRRVGEPVRPVCKLQD